MNRKINNKVFEAVTWEDHSSGGAWVSDDAINLIPPKVTSVGFVLVEDKKLLVLAQAYEPETKQSFNRSYILKKCITKRRRIRL